MRLSLTLILFDETLIIVIIIIYYSFLSARLLFSPSKFLECCGFDVFKTSKRGKSEINAQERVQVSVEVGKRYE